MRYRFHFLFLLFTFNSFEGQLSAADQGLPEEAILFQNSKYSSSEYSEFAKKCLNENQADLFLQTYRKAIENGKKSLSQEDLGFLYLYNTNIDKVNEKENRFYLLLFTGRILAKFHIDNASPLQYYDRALALSTKLHDPCLTLKCYYYTESVHMNITHDLIKVNEYLGIMDSFIRKNNLDASLTCEVDLNVTHSVLNWYIEDYAKGIEDLNSSIAYLKDKNKPKRMYELYVRRYYFENLLDQHENALRSLDTASSFIRDEKNNASYYTSLAADSFNIYVKKKDYKTADVLRRKIDLSKLDVTNDEYYDYLYSLIELNIREGDYKNADENILLYEKDLKDWNIQRWSNASESRYDLMKAESNSEGALKALEKYNHYNDLVHRQRQNFLAMGEQIKRHTLEKERELTLQIAENEVQKQKTRFLITGFTFLCLLLLLILVFRINRGLREKAELNRSFAKQLIQNTDQERNRIASELHDGLGQELLILKRNLSAEQDRDKAEKVGEIIENVRSISRELYPTLLDTIGLAAAIESQLEKIDNTENIFISSSIEFKEKMDKGIELQFFRIFQESMTNVLKYAKASSVFVSLEMHGTKVVLQIKDNGSGFNHTEKLNDANSFGLQSMKQRAESIGADLKIVSEKNKGTEVWLELERSV